MSGTSPASFLTQPVRILHTSDVHIGHVSGTPEVSHKDVCECPIHALTFAAHAYQADVLLIAGDLFDHARIPASTFASTMELLAQCAADVVLMPGNHDVHDETSLWTAHTTDSFGGLWLLDDPAGSAITLEHLGLTVWGRAMTSHAPNNRPLAGVPSRPDDNWFVVAGHGHYQRSADDAHRSSPISHEEIEATQADYVALGHWHLPTDVSTPNIPAWYSGAPMGVTTNQTACLVTLHEPTARKVTIDHVPIVPPPTGCTP